MDTTTIDYVIDYLKLRADFGFALFPKEHLNLLTLNNLPYRFDKVFNIISIQNT